MRDASNFPVVYGMIASQTYVLQHISFVGNTCRDTYPGIILYNKMSFMIMHILAGGECSGWKDRPDIGCGHGKWYKFMKKYCKKTCGFCGKL